MMDRRDFLGGLGLAVPGFLVGCNVPEKTMSDTPVVISTWAQNKKANAAAWSVLEKNGLALDAVHAGVQVPEADPEDQSVGYGGLPDRDGRVTVDACIMDHLGNCGSVMALEHILHPISVAKMVMEKTPHVQIAGEGALQFALEMGFEKVDLLTEEAKKAWKEWLIEAKYNPMITIENLLERIKTQHDTIGMIAMDATGNLAGACSTSGMAFKMRGRIGDSPIIGSGLYVDSEVGAASATGVGEELVRICGSHTVVEMMRQGFSPEESCKKTLERLVKMRGVEKLQGLQAGLIALDKFGNYGCYALQKEFTMAVHGTGGPKIIEAKSLF
jgi:N4-(beta-N-acetylglucosaminyl)-L-asparaginase